MGGGCPYQGGFSRLCLMMSLVEAFESTGYREIYVMRIDSIANSRELILFIPSIWNEKGMFRSYWLPNSKYTVP